MTSDEAIIDLYWDRNESAIARTQEKYGNYCYSISFNILEVAEDSEECVSDTWLRAWNDMPPSRPQRLKLYLAKIVRNLSFDRYRITHAKKRDAGFTAVLEELEESIPDGTRVEENYEYRELVESITAFLRTLPERESNIFLMRYFRAQSTAEIAAHFGMSENYVLVTLGRTRRKLKAHLQKEAFLYV